MPPAYPLIEMPPGEYSNMFDYQAINMAAVHNTFIQGMNAAIAHAPHITEEKVQPFMIFTLTLLTAINHHHEMEETFYFPEMEKKLGKGSLSGNVDEHQQLIPILEDAINWLKEVQDGKTKYDATVLLEKFNAFGDLLMEHLNNEIASLESSKMEAVFTVKELKDIDNILFKRALGEKDFHKGLPLAIACGNPATPWFPPFPLLLKWATRWWYSRRYRDAWEFGTMDFAGNPRKLPEPPK
jgi:hypothetical protein